MRRNDRKNHRSNKSETNKIFLFGLHTVIAALENPKRKKHALYVTKNALARLSETSDTDISRLDLPTHDSNPRDLDRMVGKDAVHQGIVLECDSLERSSIKSLAETAETIVILDQITDPHNIGAILRSASAFGVDAVITTARHAPQETATLAKSASGALDMVELIETNNLAEVISSLQKQGFLCVGLDSEAQEPLAPQRPAPKMAIVLGAEGKGLRQKTRSACDHMLRLDMAGKIKSLNVSNAAAICLFAISQ